MSFAEFIKDADTYLSKEDAFKIQNATEFKKKYELMKRLGNGAYAEVYLCKEKATGELYAAKLIDRSHVSSPKYLWSEIHILYNLDHPQIIRLKDAFASKEHVMLILEYARGGELLEYVYNHDEYDEQEAMKIIHDLLCAIDYLHSKRVVHRDIKPENILFIDEKATNMKLTDFGLSGIMKENSLLSTCAGTPGFMAPEIIKSKGYGAECDLWSIGVLAYFLLSGTLPFTSKVPFKLYQSICEGEYEYGEEFDVISDEAKDFINQCIVVDPKERLTAKSALEHPWITNTGEVKTRSLTPVKKEKVPLPGVRKKVIDYLEQRRSLKIYKTSNMAISFVTKLKMQVKLAKKESELKKEENQTEISEQEK
ncbi:Myosin light chain kinase A [Tritrichomonas foetus]|uniref:Myosin light chain kinase A n=1 Tax=Tritrichomonas foetus TaxID=1144522 RepID=A0A1J4KJB8_9EUKA|nr:Myosin light chain kinase A [Tritrichomonas foetus]|eukprot:OHT09437.1 Myosin light chain kinase A [Tritrichomonas foetus]